MHREILGKNLLQSIVDLTKKQVEIKKDKNSYECEDKVGKYKAITNLGNTRKP